MPVPYSSDLRRKAIAAVKSGKRKTDVCKMFDISRNTLDLWIKRETETGDCQAITNYKRGRPQKITDWEGFQALVECNEGMTQAQLAALWGNGVSQQNVSAALKKLGRSRKKQANGLKAQPTASGAGAGAHYLYPRPDAPASCPQNKRTSSVRQLNCPQAKHSHCYDANCPFIKEYPRLRNGREK